MVEGYQKGTHMGHEIGHGTHDAARGYGDVAQWGAQHVRLLLFFQLGEMGNRPPGGEVEMGEMGNMANQNRLQNRPRPRPLHLDQPRL